MELPGYEIRDRIYSGPRTAVFHGVDARTGQPVVLKTVSGAHPAPEQVARLDNEYEVGQRLREVAGVVRYLDRIRRGRSVTLVLEDFGGRSLGELAREQPFDLAAFLELARQLASILGGIHRHGVIHKDLTPGNVLLNRASGEVKIGDFGISSMRTEDRQEACNPTLLQGTIAYLSPEQTGRMNRVTDHRSDLYSLGVTLYEVLTGRLPFPGADAMEILHGHIAKEPVPPAALREEVPEALSAIILKLMAKAAEDRYQSAHGLAHDLAVCGEQLAATGTIGGFNIGERDRARTFRISEKLYGRKREVEQLLRACERAGKDRCELVLVSGPSGIGKSMLVHETQRRLVESRGYFTSGKFDQLAVDRPLSAWIQSLRELVRQILTEPAAALQSWAEELRAAAGVNGQILVELIPALEHVIGLQPAVVDLPPLEAKQRFEATLSRLLSTFATAAHPIVIFLDDLQWIDATSLGFLEQLLAGGSERRRHLLLIASFRDSEVGPAHPLRLTLDKLAASGLPITAIHLEPLAQHHLADLLTDSLGCEPGTVAPLAGLVFDKTGGNPFFVNQFLKDLHERELLFFDERADSWRWDEARIRALAVSDSVVDLLVAKIHRYPAAIQELLSLASCLGNSCGLTRLAVIRSSPPLEVAAALWEPVQEGLLIPTGSARPYYQSVQSAASGALIRPESAGFKFAHDRIQEAAYSQIAEERRAETHLEIGRLLLAQIPAEQRTERIFEVVGHLDLGSRLLDDAAERAELAALNLTAGRRALAATAYESSLSYLELGASLLAADAWETHYQLMFDLHLALTECRFLLGDLVQAEATFALAAGKAQTKYDLGSIYQLMIRIRQTVNDEAGGVTTGRDCLRHFDIGLPEDPARDAEVLAVEREAFDELVAGLDIPALLEAPRMQDREVAICLGVLHEVWTCSVMVGDMVHRELMSLKIMQLSLTHGHSEFSACGYVGYACELARGRGQYRRALEIGKLAVDLAERFQNPLVIPKVGNTFANFINHYVNHLGSNVAIYERSYRAARQSGDRWWGAWAASFIRQARFLAGDPLAEVFEASERYFSYLESSGYEPLFHVLRMDRQVVRNLRSQTPRMESLDGDDFREEDFRARLAGFGLGLCWYHLFKALLLYLYGLHEAAREESRLAWETKDLVPGLMMYPDCFFYDTLILARCWDSPGADRAGDLARMKSSLERMSAWAELIADPEQSNFRHRQLLMAAEIARVEGSDEAACELYEQAAAAAAASGYVHHEAIANELSARLHLARGRPKAALGYLVEARSLYRRWGAARKVELMDRDYRDTLAGLRQARDVDPMDITATLTTTLTTPGLDLESLVKAARAISRETDLSSLLRTMMRISLENAGARRGALLLRRGDELVVEAEAAADGAEPVVLHSVALGDARDLPLTIIQYVARTQEEVLLGDAPQHETFGADPYVAASRCRSILCLPLLARGTLIAIVYLENQHLVDAFSAGRLAALRLLDAQAAVSLENALLKAAEEEAPFEFQVGGSLVPGSRSYVVREADRQIYAGIRSGEFCFVLNSRQMGKSSLRVHVMHRLRREGVACVSVDVTSIGSRNLTAEQWYAGIARSLISGLGLARELELRSWWRQRDHLSPVQRLGELVGELLERVPSRIVVFVDEVDSVLSLPFNLDDFFAAIRSFYNQRADDPRFERLVFVLLGVARPSELIRDKQRTPFNIGRGIPLHGFRLAEARPLLRGLLPKSPEPEPVLKAILSWTGGHPFLTQKVCRLAVQASSKPQEGREEEWVRTLVRQRIIDNWEAQDEPEHLKTVRSRLLSNPARARDYLELYARIYQQGTVPVDQGALQEELLLTGLVSREWDNLRISNSIYRDVFNEEWIASALAQLRETAASRAEAGGAGAGDRPAAGGDVKREGRR